MTANQVNNRRNIETARNNRATERETNRSNRAREVETNRSNVARETETARSNRENERLTERGQTLNTTSNIVGSVLKGGASVGGSIIGAANDPSWYNKDAQSVKDVANISFNTPVGKHVPGATVSVADTLEDPPKAMLADLPAQPGFMSVGYVPVIGSGKGVAHDAVNIAARNIYSYVRYANSGASNYEPQDLMIYLLAMDSLYTLFAWGVRAYSALNSADRFSGFFPVDLCHALGMEVGGSSDDWSNNISNLRAFLNAFGIKISAFNVPSNFPYFARHMWMNSNIFKDMNIRRSSYYVLRPEYIYQFDNLGGGLIPVEFCDSIGSETAGVTYAQYVRLCNQTLSLLNAEEDIGIISGDILKAYGIDNMFKIGSMPEQMPLGVVYSPEVLSQIAGSTIVDIDPNHLNIVQNEAGIIGHGQRNTSTGLAQNFGLQTKTMTRTTIINKFIVNMLIDDPKPDDVMVATRLITSLKGIMAANATLTIDECGSEIITSVAIVGLGYPKTGNYAPIISSTAVISYQSSGQPQTEVMSYFAKFDWAPVLYIITLGIDNKSCTVDTTCDYGNVAYVDSTTLANMHYTALLSEFAVPDIGNRKRTR